MVILNLLLNCKILFFYLLTLLTFLKTNQLCSKNIFLGLSAPILFTEESYLNRLWRPDVLFVNSMESLFHRVTFLNFYIYVFPEGEVFFEARFVSKSQNLKVHLKF